MPNCICTGTQNISAVTWGKKRSSRWFTQESSNHQDPRIHTNIDGFDNEIPSEWDSWCRFQRDDPPSAKQGLQSYAMQI